MWASGNYISYRFVGFLPTYQLQHPYQYTNFNGEVHEINEAVEIVNKSDQKPGHYYIKSPCKASAKATMKSDMIHTRKARSSLNIKGHGKNFANNYKNKQPLFCILQWWCSQVKEHINAIVVLNPFYICESTTLCFFFLGYVNLPIKHLNVVLL